MKIRTAIISAIFLIIIDQLSKYAIRLDDGFYICNKGVAFGINIPNHFFWMIWLFIMLYLAYFVLKNSNLDQKFSKKQRSWLQNTLKVNSSTRSYLNTQSLIDTIGVVIVFSGAISNALDRLLLGCVIDFIDIKIFNYPLFNLADTFIVTGVMIIIAKIVKNKQK